MELFYYEMKKYLCIIPILLLSACGQTTPPSLEKTDEKALSEFNKKYKLSEYETVSILRKERLDISPSKSDKSIYNVKYSIAFQYNYDLSRNLMDRIKTNEKILDPTGVYKNLTSLDRNSFDDGLRKGLDFVNLFTSKEALEINITNESNQRFIKENEDLAKNVYTNCKPCVNYMSESTGDKDYQALKEKALYQAIVSYIKDEIHKIPPSGVAEEIIDFQIEK